MTVAPESSENKAKSISINNSLLIETVEDGALVFDSNSGATTLINHNALTLLNTLQLHGRIDESEFFATINGVDPRCTDANDVLALLERSRLVYRC